MCSTNVVLYKVINSLGPLPQGEGVQICTTPPLRWGTMDAEIKAPLPHLVGAQGYQKFCLSKPVVGRNIAFHAVYRASTYLISAFPAHSTSFPPNFSNSQWWNVRVQNFYLW